MLLHALRAENVLKYQSLELTDLPAEGTIGVSGENESGKSSIGEIICFALFGRTFSLAPDNLAKIIRWGQPRCVTRLELSTGDGARFLVSRFLDNEGNHGASLARLGDGDAEEPIARGVAEVEARLEDLIGFGYTELIESFYLAQREITTPHPHSVAVKAMAGVTALERVSAACNAEIPRHEEAAAEAERQRVDVDVQIAAMDLDPEALGRLEAERDETRAERQRTLATIDELERTRVGYDGPQARLDSLATDWASVDADAAHPARRDQLGRLEAVLAELEPVAQGEARTRSAFAALQEIAQDFSRRLDALAALFTRAGGRRRHLAELLGEGREGDQLVEEPFPRRIAELDSEHARRRARRTTSRVLAGVVLLAALAGWALWGLWLQAPEADVSQSLAAWLDTHVGVTARVLPFLAGLVTLLFLALLGLGARLSRDMRRLEAGRQEVEAQAAAARREVDRIDQLEAQPVRHAVAFLAGLEDAELAAEARAFGDDAGAPLVRREEAEAYDGVLREAVGELKRAMQAVQEALGERIKALREAVQAQDRALEALERRVAEEHERRRRHAELEGILEALATKRADAQRAIAVRRTAIDLLAGAARHVSQRFNTDIRDLAAHTLPSLTKGRYEHLQINESLDVKVFSSEKRDFLDLDEISSGTQRQIMLAVRLALSQKLINAAVGGRQFVFLDEPFAFFDEQRTADSLAVLPDVSPDITQIWVTSQTFPPGSRFDLEIRCAPADVESPTIVRPGAQSGGS